MSVALGTVGESVGGTVGGIAGGFAGGAIGSVFGPVGTVAGRFVGSRLGQWGGRALGGYLASKMENANEKAEPETKDDADRGEQENEDDCKGDCNKCKKISNDITKFMKKLEKRHNAMQIDRHGMKQGANPAGKGDWDGHVNAFNQAKSPLRRAINRAKREGCPIPEGAEGWLNKDAPSKSGGPTS